jgi:hypothetical protein
VAASAGAGTVAVATSGGLSVTADEAAGPARHGKVPEIVTVAPLPMV